VTINRSPAQGLWTAIAESIPFTLEKLVLLKARTLEIAKALEATESSILQPARWIRPKALPPFCALLLLSVSSTYVDGFSPLSISSLFGQPSPSKRTLKTVIIIHAEEMEVGLLADTIRWGTSDSNDSYPFPTLKTYRIPKPILTWNHERRHSDS
jgi:hypothetical protein